MPSTRILPRDLHVWQDLAACGFLDTDTIAQRHYPLDRSRRSVRRRLRRDRAHGYTRSLAPLVTYADDRKGRLPTIHCLTPAGAALLAELTGEFSPRVPRGDPAPESLLHRVGVARHIQLPVTDACRAACLPDPQ